MRPALRYLLPLLGLAAALPALGAEIVLYERVGFSGNSYAASQSISNFSNVGFNDRAYSVIVRSGTWQLCSDAYFRGRCVTLSRGEYPDLGRMDLEGRISSVRDTGWTGGGGPGGGASVGRVELFDGDGFSGRQFVVNGTIINLGDTGFNDRAMSMIVHEGNWEACEHASFGGTCQYFGPGRYPQLGVLAGRISSMRLGGGGGGGYGSGPGSAGGPALGGGGWGTGSRAVLYERQNLTGRSFVINDEVAANLAYTGFNDRAASLRVEGGYWVFCSDANFGGECQTFGPGDYPTLPWGLNQTISSGRRIHGNYPYSQTPSWQR